MSNSDNIDNHEAVKLEAALYDCAELLQVFIDALGPRRKDGSHRLGLLVSRDTAQAMMSATNRAATALTPAKLDAPDNREALALIGRVRERYPTDGVGPITLQQRNDILEVCDIAEATMTTRPAGVEEVDGGSEVDQIVAWLRDDAAQLEAHARRMKVSASFIQAEAIREVADAIECGDHRALTPQQATEERA